MKKLLCFIVLLPVFFNLSTAFAFEGYTEAVVDKNVLRENLDEREKEIVGEPVLDGKYDVKSALGRLYESIFSKLSTKLKNELGFGVRLIALAVFGAAANAFSTDKRMTVLINMVCCSAAALMIVGDVDSLIKQASQSMLKLSDYSKAAMPAIFSAAAASGAPASSAAKYAAASLSIDLLISAANKIIIPLVNLFVCVSISRSIFDNSIILSLSKFVKWAAVSCMTAMTMAFTAYISFTGLIIGSVDAAAVKTARTIIANGVPVVGKIVSDASSVVLAGASLVKNSAGVVSMIAVCTLCAAPFVDLAAKMLVFKAAAAVVDMFPGGKLSGLINDLGTAFGMLLGLVGCCGVMLFVSIISGIKVLV